MSEIALRSYVEQLDNLIERKQTDEVLAHCRHILSLFPKHLDSYRVLGKALLEKGRHTDAADIFQRVLSVAPDDFIAHVGMSIVREDEANLDAAIWHMERAFEAAPSNGAIQQELCRLYGRRDGVTPPKARLTRGALARMYYQGGLFLQAETELKTALHDDPERIDLLSLLARVFWQSDQPSEAAQACATIIAKLPYSYDANRILYSIFHEQGRGEEAAGYRQRLESLDPYETYAPPGHDGDAARRVDAGRVNLERLEYVPGADDGGSPDWLASIGARFDTEPEAAAAQPDWLAEGDQAGPPVSPLDVPASAHVPDWLRDLQPQASAQPAPAGEPASSASDWLRELGVDADAAPAAQAAGEDLPDWLRTATGGDQPGSAVPDWMLPALSEPEQPAAAPLPADTAPADMPDWLRSLTAQPGGDTVPAAPPAADPEATLIARPAQPPAAPDAVEPLPTVAEADLPDWLRAMAPAAEAAVTDANQSLAPEAADAALPEPSLEPTTGMETLAHSPTAAALDPSPDVPAWLDAVTSDVVVTAAEPADAAPEPAAGIPDWLRDMAPDAGVAAAPPAETAEADADVADWLQSISAQASDLSPAAAAAASSAEPAASIPDWLRAMAPSAEASPPEAEAVAPWLAGQVLDSGTESAAQASPPAASIEDPGVPDWLRAPDQAAAPPEPPAIPDWLQAVAATAPPPDTGPLAAREPEPGPAEMPPASAVELPDYLQPASPEAIARAEQPFVFDAAEGDDDFSLEPDEPDLVLPADIPEWLQALAPLSPDPVDAIAFAAPFGEPAPDAEPAEAAGLGFAGALSVASAEDAAPWLSGLEEVPAPPAPPDSLVIPASEADLEQAAALDIPAWAQPHAPGPTDTIASWLKSKDVPEWLRPDAPGLEAEAEMPPTVGAAAFLEPEAAAPEPALPPDASADLPPWAQTQAPGATDTIVTWLAGKEQPAAPEPAAAEGEAIDEDEALRWLEGLAAKHGARPEELITAPEDRPAETPAWIAAQQGDVAALDNLAASEASAAQAAEAEVPDWLRAPEAEPEPPAWLTEALAGPPVDASTPVDPRPPEPVAQVEAQAEPPSLDTYLSQMEAALPADDIADTAPVHAPVAPTAPFAPDAATTAQAPEPSEMDAEEALRWLEGLAAKQGAQPEELITAPEERLTEAPAWIAAEQASAPPVPALEPEALAEIDAAEALLPASLAELAAAVPAEPEAAAVELAAAEPVAELEADDEALRWLESLAARHGAQPEELLTAPDERLAEPPAWVAAEAGAAAALAPQQLPEPEPAPAVEFEPEPLPEPEPAATIAPPDWLPASLVSADEAAPAVLAAAETEPTTSDLRLSRLAERLAETRRAREAEIEARFAEQRAEQEAARRVVQERLEKRAVPEPAPATPPVLEPALAAEALPTDWPAAADRYAAWVQSGEHLDQAIRELEALVHQQTPPAPILRVLGDAYSHRGHLADALDAYRLALERL